LFKINIYLLQNIYFKLKEVAHSKAVGHTTSVLTWHRHLIYIFQANLPMKTT